MDPGDDIGPGVHGDQRRSPGVGQAGGEDERGASGGGTVHADDDRAATGRRHRRRRPPDDGDRAGDAVEECMREGACEHPRVGRVPVAPEHEHPGAVGPFGEAIRGYTPEDVGAQRYGTGPPCRILQLAQPRRHLGEHRQFRDDVHQIQRRSPGRSQVGGPYRRFPCADRGVDPDHDRMAVMAAGELPADVHAGASVRTSDGPRQASRFAAPTPRAAGPSEPGPTALDQGSYAAPGMPDAHSYLDEEPCSARSSASPAGPRMRV